MSGILDWGDVSGCPQSADMMNIELNVHLSGVHGSVYPRYLHRRRVVHSSFISPGIEAPTVSCLDLAESGSSVVLKQEIPGVICSRFAARTPASNYAAALRHAQGLHVFRFL